MFGGLPASLTALELLPEDRGERWMTSVAAKITSIFRLGEESSGAAWVSGLLGELKHPRESCWS